MGVQAEKTLTHILTYNGFEVTGVADGIELDAALAHEQALADLKASIEKHGVLQPVLVRQGADGALLLVSGERRFQA